MTKKTTARADGNAAGTADEIEQVLGAFRETTGLEVCFKLLQRDIPLTGLEPLLSGYNLHQSAFCSRVKSTRNEQCKQCDLRDVPARCVRERGIFSHVCHAGAGEVIIPLFIDGRLTALAYVGQFRTRRNQPAELPLFSREKLAGVKALSRLLSAYLAERLRTPRYVSESSRGFRDDAIRRYLEKNLRENPSLSDLAGHLGLSKTRTAHAVREATGSSFVELRDELRMKRARDLLEGTYHKVAHVASECGFSSTQYFHRFFRRQTRKTPLAFRRLNRSEV